MNLITEFCQFCLLVFNSSTVRGLSLVHSHYIYEYHSIGPPCYNLEFSLHTPECLHRPTSISSTCKKHFSSRLQPLPVLEPCYSGSSLWKSFPLLSCLKLFRNSVAGSSEDCMWLKFLERRIVSSGVWPLWIVFPDEWLWFLFSLMLISKSLSLSQVAVWARGRKGWGR